MVPILLLTNDATEPSGYCYQCGYGFNFDFGLTSLEEVFAQVLYADPTPIQAYAPQVYPFPVQNYWCLPLYRVLLNTHH